MDENIEEALRAIANAERGPTKDECRLLHRSTTIASKQLAKAFNKSTDGCRAIQRLMTGM